MTPPPAPGRRGPARDDGLVLWQVVLVIAVLAVLARVAGPSVAGLLTRAREVSLTATVTAAARSLQDVYDDFGVAAADVNPDGSPKPALLARLGAADSAEGLDWRAVWAFDGEDESHVVRVQFLKTMLQQPRRGVTGGPTACAPFLAAAAQSYHGACSGSSPGPVPPTVSWLGADWLAARVHARAETGEWACALVIHAVDTHTLSVEGAKQTSGSDKGPLLLVRSGRARESSTTADPALTWQEARDRLKRSGGVWYDSGDEAVEGGLFDCSPVRMVNTGRNGRSIYPPAEGEWEIQQSTAPGAGVDVTGTLTVAP